MQIRRMKNNNKNDNKRKERGFPTKCLKSLNKKKKKNK